MKLIISLSLIVLTNYSMSQIFYDSVKNNVKVIIIGMELPNKKFNGIKMRYNSFHTNNYELLEKFRTCTSTPRVHIDSNENILQGFYWKKILKLDFEVLERFINGVIVESWSITNDEKYTYTLSLDNLNYTLFIENGKPIGEEYIYLDKNKSTWISAKYKYRRNRVKIIIKRKFKEVETNDNCVKQFYKEWVYK